MGGTSIFLLYVCDDDNDDGKVGGMIDFGRGNRNTRGKKCHLIHHISHLPHPGASPDRRVRKVATNLFSYGAVDLSVLW
jgi:hypothetical protein